MRAVRVWCNTTTRTHSMTIRRHHATRRSRWNPFSVMRLKTQAFRGPFEHKKQFGPRGEKMYICVTCVLVWEATLLFLVTALSSSPRVASFPHYSQAVCRMSIPLELMSISNNNNLLDPHSIKPVPKNIPPLPTTVTSDFPFLLLRLRFLLSAGRL